MSSEAAHAGPPTRAPILEGRPRAVVGGPRAVAPADGADGRVRDLLPLPVGAGLDAVLAARRHALGDPGRSAGVRSRGHARRNRQDAWLHEAVEALNELGGRGVAPPRAGTRLTAAQLTAVDGLAKAFGSVPPPPSDLTPSGAWTALRGSEAGYGPSGQAAGEFAVYQSGKIALPKVGGSAILLSDALPPAYRKLLGDDGTGLMLPSAEAAAARADLGLGEAALDPIIRRSPCKYAEFLTAAYDSGVLEVSSDVSSHVGVFFVHKKDGTLRVIFDPRWVNAGFRRPDSVALSSGENLGDIELQPDEVLFSAEGDVEN